MVGVVARPDLCRLLEETVRVATVSAPAGSGKSMLLRSWIAASQNADRVAWVTVGRDERGPQRFWLSAVDALRRTAAGARLVNPASAAPEADGWALVERLLTDLDGLRQRLWLVVDDLHELGPAALGQLELLVLRAPAGLLLIGEMLYSAAGQPATGDGETYFVNTDGGKGPWRTQKAPIPVPGAASDPCTNYSPTLAPLDNGSRLLEITTHKNSGGTCLAYFATTAVAP